MSSTGSDPNAAPSAAGAGVPAPAPAVAQGGVRSSVEILTAIEALGARIADLEDAVAEAVEELGKVRKSISELKHSAATRKQVKKLKKVLDQLEVIDVGPDDSPDESGGRSDRRDRNDRDE